MSKVLADFLKIKIDGKYIKTAQEVADYFGVQRNTVYESRSKRAKYGDIHDKLMLFDELEKVVSNLEHNFSVGKMTVDGKEYLITLKENKGKKMSKKISVEKR
jgi:hypothetical protein